MISGREIRHAVRRLTSALAFGGSMAAIALLVGTRDMESYEHAFFSLDRGTAVQAVHVLGHPVYTLAIGLGVRLPLQASLGASPVAALAPYMPAPLTYWALLAFSIAAVVMVVRHALEPVCGRLVSWLAMVLLFCSVPMVNYTVSDDFPEAAVTYCAFVGCVFAPHALLALLDSHASSNARRLAGLSVAGTVWSLVGLSHPGFWPLLAGALVLAATLALCRSDHPFRTRLTVVAVLAAASLLAVALQVPDLARELNIAREAGEVRRSILLVPTQSLISANLFPFGPVGARMPFMFLVMALLSLSIGLTLNDAHARRLIVGSALMSIVLGVGAATLSPGLSAYAPSSTWVLRDPAAAFAVLSAACAAGAVRRSRGVNRFVRAGPVVAALVLAGLQGPSFAASVVLREIRGPGNRPWSWNQDMTTPEGRASIRGLTRARVSPGERLALWPGVRNKMRDAQGTSTDFADAGYLLVTAWTKQRTMRGLVEPNEGLFNQTSDLSSQVLCDSSAVRFLRLRYLLMPPDVECGPWTRLPGLLVDGWLEVGAATEWDDMVRALPVARVSERVGREPALSAGSLLLPALVPLSGTSLRVAASRVVIRLDDSSVAGGQALVLPVAYDAAWRASSGRVHNVGGLVALIGVDQRQVTVDYVPDGVAVLRAASMTVAQLLAVVGLLGLAFVRRT